MSYPPDLEKLYDHMMNSMIASNLEQGSTLLQLVLRSMNAHGSYPMTVLQLSFAEDEDIKALLKEIWAQLLPSRRLGDMSQSKADYEADAVVFQRFNVHHHLNV
jgi:hypothetical protein